METPRIRELFRSDAPTVVDKGSLGDLSQSIRSDTPREKDIALTAKRDQTSNLIRSDEPWHADTGMLTSYRSNRQSFHIKYVQNPMHLEKKQRRSFIRKIKDALRRKK